jgi:callose synthase
VFCAFLTYTFLEPLFVPVGSNVAMVFLYILAINSALVGMSLGVLLPVLVPGVCFGGMLALLVGAFGAVSSEFFFPAVGGALALIFCTVSARYVTGNSLFRSPLSLCPL